MNPSDCNPSFVDQTVIHYPGPFSAGPYKVHGALCEDGKQRIATCSSRGADTFFSIPARVRARGKTVSGYVTRDSVCVRCGVPHTSHNFERADGSYDFSSPVCSDGRPADIRELWLFRTYRYGKNASAILGEPDTYRVRYRLDVPGLFWNDLEVHAYSESDARARANELVPAGASVGTIVRID